MTKRLQLWMNRLDTPMGEFVIVGDGDGNLRATDWTDHKSGMLQLLQLQYGKNSFSIEPTHNLKGLKGAIGDCFAGELAAIDGLPVQTADALFQR